MFGRKSKEPSEKGFTHRVLEAAALSNAESGSTMNLDNDLSRIAEMAIAMQRSRAAMPKEDLSLDDSVALETLASRQTALLLIASTLAVNRSLLVSLDSRENTLEERADSVTFTVRGADPVLDLTDSQPVIDLRTRTRNFVSPEINQLA